jgi:hypothetical protein
MRAALVLCAIVVGALAVWAITGRSDRARATGPRHTPEEHRLPEVEPVPAEETTPVEIPTAEVEGTVVVVDGKGGEHAAESGRLLLRSSSTREERDVAVEDGRWRTRVRKDSEYEVLDLVLAGRRAFVESPRFAPDAGPVLLRAWWPAPLLLHVVAAETGAPLADIDVVGGDAHWEREFLHPMGLATVPVATRARSPLTIQEATLPTYWVRAPGRAWGPLRVDPRAGGERTVRLVRGGAVDAQLSNFVPSSRATLRLYPVGRNAPAVQAAPDAGGRCAIEDLRPGSYMARVEIGPWFEKPLLLAASTEPVEVVADARAFVALDLADAGAGILVPFGGTLEVPREWGEVEPRIEIRALRAPRGAARPRVTLSGTEWSAGNVAPGSYVIDVQPFGLWQEEEVPLAGNEAVRIEVPPPGDVTVRVIDEETRVAVPVAAIRWVVLARNEFVPRAWVEVNAGAEPGTFRFLAPQGDIVARIPAGEYAAETTAIRVGAAGGTCTIKARRCPGIRIALEESGTPVPAGLDFSVGAAPVDGEGEVVSETHDGMTVTLRVSRPGRYRLRFGAFAGYAAIPERTVEAASGTTTDVVVSLAQR